MKIIGGGLHSGVIVDYSDDFLIEMSGIKVLE